ncbi:MAG: glyoxalase [Gammaproteobacteria bacterium]|nr:glyoxalase [Gammaproteobacteria bacterium]
MKTLCLVLVLAFSFASHATATAVDAIGITVDDADRSMAFYRDVLSFEVVADREVTGDDYEHLFGVFGARVRMVRMRLGTEFIELIDYVAAQGRPMPLDTKANDGWFQHIAIVVSDMDAAYALLRHHKVEHASTGPQRLPDWNPNAGGISAFYFRDPDRNYLELITFPSGKGQSRWQESGGRLFLGIDHTAIVVADTDRAIAFYRELSLLKVGESENHGIEQERLNNVFGARLRITALRGSQGPGVELLEYLAPRTGRAIPMDTSASDLWHWQIHMVPDAFDPAARPVVVRDGALGISRGQMVRDPDGHATLMMEPVGGVR